MVSPLLSKKSQELSAIEVNDNTKKLFQIVYQSLNEKIEKEDDSPKIGVSTLVSKAAFFYEKLRNAIDYEEDHLLRKNAIFRIIKRQIVIEGALKILPAKEISIHLLDELIRASYLPNNKIPETKIDEVTVVLEKYVKLKNLLSLKINSEINIKNDVNKARDLLVERNKLVNWIIALAACEIEESLAKNKIKQTVVNNLFSFLSTNIKLPAELPYEQDLEIQIYLSISRTFSRFDEDMLSFVLFKYYNSHWVEESVSDETIKDLSLNVRSLYQEVQKQLKHPLIKQLDRITNRYALYENVLLETVSVDPVKTYDMLRTDNKSFITSLKKTCNKKYKKAKNRLWRAAVRSIIYIFLTKSIFVFAIEIPAINFFNEPLNILALAINVSFPAVLLFLIVAFTRVPNEANTEKIISGIKEISFVGSERTQPIRLKAKTSRAVFVSFIFNTLYVASFFVSVYFVIWVLNQIHFTWVSITIFLFFLAFVSFFSVVVTKSIKELIVIDKKENLFTFLLDIFYMPIIIIGKWLSNNVSKVNIFIFVFDFLIEAPFKILVEVADDWTRYVKERKDNID
jgi:hypothetical protein